MAYEVTATRKRPQTFDELVGQDFIVATLKNSILQSRIAHAYLFSGPRGVGKTSAARILAKALNCEQGPTDSPCGRCIACREIAQGNSLDVIEIDGASNTSVNDVREIKDEVLFAPNSSRYKIYIIDEVHMLSNSAFNALLKTIEEPPPYIVFIFATTEVHKVPATIRSRCQQFNFRLISAAQIKEMLRRVVEESAVQAEETALFWIAKEATGSLRDAYTLLDQVMSFSREGITLERIREKLGLVGIDQINQIAEYISYRDKKSILQITADILDRGVSVEQFVADLTDYFRTLLFLKCGIHKESLLSASPEDFPSELYESLGERQLEKAIELLLELHRNLRFSLQQRFDLELVMCQLADLQELVDPAEVVETIRRVKDELLASPSTPSDSPRRPRPRPAPAGMAPAAADGQDSTQGAATLEELVAAVRKEKLALSTSLSKADSWQLADGRLRLFFKAQDRFSAEQVLKERDAVLRHAAALYPAQKPVRLEVNVASGGKGPGEQANDQAEIVKKIFRGEIVEGE